MRMLAEDELREAVLLIFANKQDLPNAMNAAEITDKLGLHSLRNRNWYIQVREGSAGYYPSVLPVPGPGPGPGPGPICPVHPPGDLRHLRRRPIRGARLAQQPTKERHALD